MTHLRVLSFARNQLSGSIPKSLSTLTELVSIDMSRNKFSGGLPFRPALQPALHQMKLYGNDDLVAPDQWLRSNTLRFQMERATPSLQNDDNDNSRVNLSASGSDDSKLKIRGRAQIVDSRVAAPFQVSPSGDDVGLSHTTSTNGRTSHESTNGRSAITASETLKTLRSNQIQTGLWSNSQTPTDSFSNGHNRNSLDGQNNLSSSINQYAGTATATETFARSDALAAATWSDVSRGRVSAEIGRLDPMTTNDSLSSSFPEWPLCEVTDEALLLEELKRLELPIEDEIMTPLVQGGGPMGQRRWG
mmetsp:Transcript_6100/g.7486  ORF Transcript_6100/g.7486 Transcript_6100/m.7486 type:complete len:304 (+) Transcript_6100:1297-2208(+)